MKTGWTERRIISALVRNQRSPVRAHGNRVVVPTTFGPSLGWEADVLAVNDSGYMTEVEIKTNRADFIADAKKAKHSPTHRGYGLIRRFFYAMPAEVWAKSQDVWRAPGAGVIVVRPSFQKGWDIVDVVVKAEIRRGARKVDDFELLEMYRLLSARYWDAFAKGIPVSHV